MSDYRAILDRARSEFPPPGMPIQGVLRRRDRKRRNQRVRTAVFVLAIAVAGLAFAAKTIGHGSLRPARPPLPTSWSRVAADPAVFGRISK